jgi:hypothetical protein
MMAKTNGKNGKNGNDRFATIETIRKAIEDQLEAINALPATLLRQAFNGEL